LRWRGRPNAELAVARRLVDVALAEVSDWFDRWDGAPIMRVGEFS
jgi:hypothetical protein